MCDIIGVGAITLPWSLTPGAKEDTVAMLETELLLVGLPGRAGMKDEGEAGKPADGCLYREGAVDVDEGGTCELVGVGVGVDWLED
jgi:hypothetical protein